MKRSRLIEQVEIWRSQWEDAVRLAEETGDRRAAAALHSKKPDFPSLIRSLESDDIIHVTQAQGDLWSREEASSSVSEIVGHIRLTVSKLELPEFDPSTRAMASDREPLLRVVVSKRSASNHTGPKLRPLKHARSRH